MTEKQYNKNNPRFRDEFGCVNDLLTGESYLCGENGFIGERDAINTAIALSDSLNNLYNENEQLKKALLFFIDVANTECSSNWHEDMEKDCQKLFNCSYEEAEEKYGGYEDVND